MKVQLEQQKTLRYIRKNIFIRLTNAQQGGYTPERVRDYSQKLFNCQAIICGMQLRKDVGYDIFCGIRNNSASKNTARAKLKRVFLPLGTEEPCQYNLEVFFEKSWNSVCRRVLDKDSNPLCWNISLGECLKRATNQRAHQRSVESIELLKSMTSWQKVLQHPAFHRQSISHYEALKKIYGELHQPPRLTDPEDQMR